MRRQFAHQSESTDARVLRAVERAGGEVVDTVELRSAFGQPGVDAANRLARRGEIERVRVGAYRARRAT